MILSRLVKGTTHSQNGILYSVIIQGENIDNVNTFETDEDSFLISLDLSSAFDTVDHSGLLLLESKFLVKDTALK